MGNIAVNQEKENTSQEQQDQIIFNAGHTTGELSIASIFTDLEFIDGETSSFTKDSLIQSLNNVEKYNLAKRTGLLKLISEQLQNDLGKLAGPIHNLKSKIPDIKQRSIATLDKYLPKINLQIPIYSSILENLPPDLLNSSEAKLLKNTIESGKINIEFIINDIKRE